MQNAKQRYSRLKGCFLLTVPARLTKTPGPMEDSLVARTIAQPPHQPGGGVPDAANVASRLARPAASGTFG